MAGTGAATWLTDACCVLVCAIAAVRDLRTHRVPNALNLAGFALGLALSFATGAAESGLRAGFFHGVLPSLVGAAALFGVFLVAALLGAVGMGDAKLMGVVGAFLGWTLVYRALVDVLVAGALVALVRGFVRGELRAALANLGRGVRSLVGTAARPARADLHPMPYAVAILLGVSWAILGRYVVAARFP